MSDQAIESLETWLNEPQYPRMLAIPSERQRYNRDMLYHFHQSQIVYDCLDAAKSETGSLETSIELHDAHGGKPYAIHYTVTNVRIEIRCPDEHEFGPWKYDYMGGDLRSCERCGFTEHV